ncbi:hypothetical protein GOP47_0029259 [Adiantum capillus-veneris]|nr:hypothetical protein GOP47_0029259 [Adiantum capillus-veneris]
MPPSPLFPASPLSSPSLKEKDKGVNVQVLLRCRPLNEDELRINVPQVILCNEARREVTIATKLIDRTFTFDKVFGQQAQQKDLYGQAISPIVNEVLEGFNCTIFAYGQTGTGKTYTMEGAARKSKIVGELPAEAGVIPRSVEQIFQTLESQKAEYSMKVTFLELYNEEITDLLVPEDISKSLDERQRKPLTLMEDGKGGVLVRGLEEEVVYSANEIFNLLERGSSKRRTAETLLNKQSSRSHSIFSIIIHIKEASLGGEELIKCGRLNLVDLAGSENVSRSGSREGRAREAGEINKSLLTLGRVITSLVEHLGHVPYRDSKLTRLLRESLGGRTKTCIIATISPSLQCLEESLSTLDYAYRAKSIKNKPELNQKVMKAALIKDFHMEIERLKAEVAAAREKNGIYLPRDRYLQEEAEKKALSDRLEQMESDMSAKHKQIVALQTSLESQEGLCTMLNEKLDATQNKLEQTGNELTEARKKIQEAQYSIMQREHIIRKLQQSENVLIEKAVNLQSDLEISVNDIMGLHLKIDRKNNIETQNHRLVQDFYSNLGQNLETVRSVVASSVTQQQQQFQNMEQELRRFMESKEEVSECLKKQLSSLKDSYSSGFRSLSEMVEAHDKESLGVFGKLNTASTSHFSSLEELLSAAVADAEALLKGLHTALHDQESEIAGFTQQLQQGALKSIEASRAISHVTMEFFMLLERSTTNLCQSLYQSHQAQQDCLSKLEETYQECSRREEELLLQKFAEMLADTMARKSELVSTKLKHLRDMGVKDFNEMEQGMLDVHATSSTAQFKWEGFMSRAEAEYAEHSSELAGKHAHLQKIVSECSKGTKAVGDKWIEVQKSLQELDRNSLAQVESIAKEGIHNSEQMLAKYNECNESVGSNIESGHAQVLGSIEGSLTTDREAGESALESCSNQLAALTGLQTLHHESTLNIEGLAERCFKQEFMEDTPTCTTPKIRSIEVPSQASIDALRAPDLDTMMQEFEEENQSLLCEKREPQKPVERETKIPIFADSSLLKDGRVPLTAMNQA